MALTPGQLIYRMPTNSPDFELVLFADRSLLQQRLRQGIGLRGFGRLGRDADVVIVVAVFGIEAGRVQALLAQPAHHHGNRTVSDDDALGAGGGTSTL